jgi:tetratricopeptide (TPR) repeat protein
MRHPVFITLLIGVVLSWTALPVDGRSGGDSRLSVADGALELPAMDDGALECDSAATVSELLASAREMFVADNHALAEMLYRCVLAREPANLSAILELSVVYETAGKLQYAYVLVARASTLRPLDEEISERKKDLLGRVSIAIEAEVDEFMARGAYQKALPKVSALLEQRPDDAELYYKRARCYLELGDAAGAIVEIDKASGIRQDIRYSVLRSHALKLGRSKDIDALVREAERLTASAAPHDRQRALAVLSQILARDPEHEWAKREFVAIGNGQEFVPADAATPNTTSNLAVSAKRATSYARAFAGSAWRLIRGHLSLVIATLLVLVVFASPLTSAITLGFDSRRPLSGRLSDFHIQEVLSLIHSQGKSGLLRVKSKSVKARVYFVGGEIYHCTSGRTFGQEAVRDLLARGKDGHFVLTKLPRSFKRTVDVPFSLVLMDVGERSFLERTPAGSLPSSTPHKKSRMKSLLEGRS